MTDLNRTGESGDLVCCEVSSACVLFCAVIVVELFALDPLSVTIG